MPPCGQPLQAGLLPVLPSSQPHHISGADAGAPTFPARRPLQIGNGLFWTFPFMLQWLAQRLIGSGLIDNGRLDPTYFG